MSEEEINKRKVKTVSSCIELVKSMTGTRNGIIAYNTTFRLDLENTCYKASICEELQQENSQLKDNWNKLKEIVKSQSDFKLKVRNKELWFEVDELLSKMEELEKGVNNE